jgi:hypothetical protein
MNVQVVAEKDILKEAAEILLQNMPPSKAARFWASWQITHGSYLEWRETEFADETVMTLYEKVAQYQADRGKAD